MVTDAADAGNEASAESAPEDSAIELVEFMVNPVNGTIIKL
jgi:hypothetical protein